MRPKVLAALAALGLCASNSSAEGNRTAWIEVDKENASVTLQIFAALEFGETGTFQLTSRKFGKSGAAVSQQSGRIRSGDGHVAGPFSTSRFSLQKGDELQAELVVTTSNGRTLTDKIFTIGD